MDIHEIRQLLKTKSIFNIPLRATFYARVSSESDEQLNSLDNQINYYTNFIQQDKSWTFVNGYIDEGISGISTAKRENFQAMIADAKANKFDIIITKEISRFARNTLDSIQYTRELMNYGVGVFFQNDNICTVDEDSELRLTIMSSIAQDELRKLSSRIKFGHQQAIKNNVVLGNSRIFGYKKQDKKLVIDESEVQMVIQLFELYATNKYSLKQIENIFWEKGYRNHNGNRISHTTMSEMISNPKYKGYYVGNKVKIIDMFTKKQKFLPPEEWVTFKDETGDIVPTIVSEELWEQANEVLTKRSNDVKNRHNICNHANLLTGKLICTSCGKPFYRRESKDRTGISNSQWICSGKIKNGADSCDSFVIYESDIIPILHEVFTETSANVETLIDQYVNMFNSINQQSKLTSEIEKLQNKIELSEKKKGKLLGYNASGQILDNDFISMMKDIDKEINQTKIEINEREDQLKAKAEFKKRIDDIRNVLKSASKDANVGVISQNFVDKYINKIYVTPKSKDKMRLDVKIFTDELSEKYLDNIRLRSGHTFKIMNPERSTTVTRNYRWMEGHTQALTYLYSLNI